MHESSTDSVDIARAYYDSEDADRFYATIWGGEDIHIGMYVDGIRAIRDASLRTVHYMALLANPSKQPCTVLDLGAGYGGAARVLASRFKARVTAFNLSLVENERNRKLNEEQGLSEFIDVVEGNFENLPFDDEHFDIVWSQDAFLHSNRRERVLSEAARVLKPGGQLVFTDPMQTDDCPDGVLQPILNRIHLSSLASPGFYREQAPRVGFKEIVFHPFPQYLVAHYSAILKETTRREAELIQEISETYIQNMKKGLMYWIEGGQKGHLTWGIFKCKKHQ